MTQCLTFASALVGLVALNIALVGRMIVPLSLIERTMILVAAGMIMQFNAQLSLTGVAVLLAVVAMQPSRPMNRG
jgi:TRAP-type uncharacterized transport system fused permease subunit